MIFPPKPKIIFKDIPIDWKLIGGSWDNRTDTIIINIKFGKFIQRSTFFHEMLHRKFHRTEIFHKRESKAGIFEELFCGFAGLTLSIINSNYNIKLQELQ